MAYEDVYRRIRLCDEETEGYYIIPNYYISVNVDPVTLTYEGHTIRREEQEYISIPFNNRSITAHQIWDYISHKNLCVKTNTFYAPWEYFFSRRSKHSLWFEL